MKIIGIAGRRGSGKSTVAKELVRLGYVEVAFADVMKRFVRELTGVSEESLWGDSDFRIEVRDWLKDLGTRWGRGLVGKDVWLNYCKRQIDKLSMGDCTYRKDLGIRYPIDPILYYDRAPHGVVISDVRFENEYHAIKSWGGEIWVCRRDGENRDDTHESETGVAIWSDEKFDRVINNNEPISDLHLQLI